ncbi:MAG: uroporphyrinogen-III synthase [Hyphomicrobiaceae bacterium]|nr:uroporphyrinogen-III synthase [Hyphomicrobiaceae bacterium]
MLRILVTRPEPDATRQAIALRRAGHHPIIAPVLEVESLSFIELADEEPVAATIATSRNAVRALTASPLVSRLSRLPAFAVGEATGAALAELGFSDVIIGPGTGRELAEVVAGRVSQTAGRIIVLRGESIAFDVAAALAVQGYPVLSMICYRTRPVTALAEEARQALAGGEVDAVVLMSPATARAFAALLQAAAIEPPSPLTCLCLSHQVAGALPVAGPFSAIVAPAPNSEEILALVNRMAALSRR